MIVFDNIIFSLQKSGGISVVWKELLERFLLTGESGYRLLEYPHFMENIFRRSMSVPPHHIHYREKYVLPIQRYLSPRIEDLRKPFIFHSSYYRYSTNPHAINITTVHDFTYEHYVKGMARRVHSLQKNTAIRHSAHVVCISQNTKKDLLRFCPDVDPQKIRVIHNGVSPKYHPLPPSDDTHQLPFPPKSYVLFVGAREGYKDFSSVVEVLRDFKQLNLVIVGSDLSNKETQTLNHQIGASRYRCVGKILSEKLNILYNHAFALLYPSLYEGFGIPVIEAQRAGCPVVARHASSIPEVIGDNAPLVQQSFTEEFGSIYQRLNNASEREKVIASGMKNARRFTWDNMFEQYMALYREALQH